MTWDQLLGISGLGPVAWDQRLRDQRLGEQRLGIYRFEECVKLLNSTFSLPAQQGLVMMEQHFVNFEKIMLTFDDEIFNNNIKHLAMG